MRKKIMRCGIMSRKAFMERTFKIARGDYRPGRDEPKVWFESLKTMAQILSEGNMELLRIIEEKKPESITALAAMTGRKKGNLSRTLKKMQQYGIVDLKRKENNLLEPVVMVTDFQLDYGISG